MQKILSSLTIFPLAAAGVLAVSSNAQAGLLVPPPPDSNLTIQSIQAAGAGVVFFLRDNNFDGDNNPLTGPGGTYSGFCNTLECAYFDFRPSVGGGDGDIFFSNTQPSDGSSVFENVIGTTGKIKDVVLPFLGAPIDEPNLNIPLSITGFIDANPMDATIVDTFDATILRSITFTNDGSGSKASLSFDGFWNILDPEDNEIKQYFGTVNFSQALSQNVNEVLNGTATISGARQNNGYFAAPSIQANVKGQQVPEPGALAALAAFASSAALLRKQQKKQ